MLQRLPMRTLTSVISALLCLAPAALAQETAPPAARVVPDEVAALAAQYETARKEWKVAYAAAREAGVRLRERPADPVDGFYRRFEALLDAGSGPAALWLVDNVHKTDLNRAQRRERQRSVVTRALSQHAREPWLEELCFLLARRKRDFDRESLDAWLVEWRGKSLPPALEAAALWLESESLGWNAKAREEHATEIAARLRAALEADPTSKAGTKAGGQLFRAAQDELAAELTPWMERELGAEMTRPDLAPWRASFADLAAAKVEPAGVWVAATTWLAEPDADFERLTDLLEDAQLNWGEHYDAAAADEASGAGGLLSGMSERIALLFAAQPEALFWFAFEDLAQHDPRAGAWLVRHASSAPLARTAAHERQFQRLEALVRDHGDAEWAADLAQSLVGNSRQALGSERVLALCERWAAATTNEEVEVHLRFLMAVVRLEQDEGEGVALLRGVIERWPDHFHARAAQGRIAALALKIGRLAPEITGRDLDGTDFKLSDYRGKVVVLDFWGDW